MFINAVQFRNYLNRSECSQLRHDYKRRILNTPPEKRYALMSLKESRKILSTIKQSIVQRQSAITNTENNLTFYISKWIRPWDVVPELINFVPPEDDYGIGVEVEFGFVSVAAAIKVANHIKNWHYVALDFEGGENPIEATFSPVLYSKLNSKSQVNRYLDFLNANKELVTQHNAAESWVGTHVNVSANVPVSTLRAEQLSDVLRSLCSRYDHITNHRATDEQVALRNKYFGRNPYGYCVPQAGGKYVEFKLFNSTTDKKVLRRYINVSVALMSLLNSYVAITPESVKHALETGYSGKPKSCNWSTFATPDVPNESSTSEDSNFALAA